MKENFQCLFPEVTFESFFFYILKQYKLNYRLKVTLIQLSFVVLATKEKKVKMKIFLVSRTVQPVQVGCSDAFLKVTFKSSAPLQDAINSNWPGGLKSHKP